MHIVETGGMLMVAMKFRFNWLARRDDEEEDDDTLPKAEGWSGEISPQTHKFAIDLVVARANATADPMVEEEED